MSDPQIAGASEQVFELSPTVDAAPCCARGWGRFLRLSLYGVAAVLLTGLLALQASPQLVNSLGFIPERTEREGAGCCHAAAAIGEGCSVEACPFETGCAEGAACHAAALEPGQDADPGQAIGLTPPAVPLPETL